MLKLIPDLKKIPEDFTGIVEYDNGTKFWMSNGKYHRIDGPACEYFDGFKSWHFEGKLHRLDGPAVEWSNGTKRWFINGIEFSEKEHGYYVQSLNK